MGMAHRAAWPTASTSQGQPASWHHLAAVVLMAEDGGAVEMDVQIRYSQCKLALGLPVVRGEDRITKIWGGDVMWKS